MKKPITKARWKVFFRKHLQPDYWIIMVRRRPWLKWSLLSFLFLFTVLPIGGFLTFYYYTGYIPFVGDLKDDNGRPLDFDKLARSDFKKASYVYAADGKTKIGIFFDDIRDQIKINEVPPIIKEAFIAAEDQRFYTRLQFGIDPIATFRAGAGDFFHWAGFKYVTRSGASGIPQQLTRMLYAEGVADFRNRKPNILRKLKEARVAIQLVKKYPKDKILEGFLNLIYFGHGVNGVAEATRRYYGKDIRNDKFTPLEAAILASLNKAPSLYCPIYHKPEELELKEIVLDELKKELKHKYELDLVRENVRMAKVNERNDWVLLRMRKENYITAEQYESQVALADNEPLQSSLIHFTPLKNVKFGYASRFVKEMLMFSGYPDEDLTDYGGFRIVTSIDADIQKIATEEFNNHLALINSEIPAGEEKLEGAFVIIENKTGRILALSGGHNFEETQYNRILASRSPGSSFKPFTYAAAFEYYGKTFDDKICNCPFRMRGANGKAWAPKNFKEDNPVGYGYIPLPVGMIRSVNLATLNLARSDGGADPTINIANKVGIWGNPRTVRDGDGKIWFKESGQKLEGGLVPLLPTVIGASDVNLLELTNGYAAFARGGIYMRPTLIMEIKDSEGKAIYKAETPQEKRALSKETADKITILMRAVTKVGTAKISMKDIGQQLGCKTGTSNGPKDLSLMCFTPEITMGIRVGYDSNKVIELPQYMKAVSKTAKMQVSGGWVVGPLFRKIIDKIYLKRPKEEFPPEIEQGLEQLLAVYPARYK